MNKIKIKINGGKGNSEESKKVQEVLFKLGYSWNLGKSPRYLDAGFIYGADDGGLTWGVASDSGLAWFEDSVNHPGFVEVRLVEQTTYGIEEIPNQRETIKIGDAVYDKQQFEEAVKNLKKIN